MILVDNSRRKPCANPAEILFAIAPPKGDLAEDLARRAAELRPGPQPWNAGITPPTALEYIEALDAIRADLRGGRRS